MKRFLLLLLCCAAPAFAQRTTGSITGNTQCVSIIVNANTSSSVAINVSGTWSATLQPEVLMAGQAAVNTTVTPTGSTTSQATITANGLYVAGVAGVDQFQVCSTAFVSGTAVINLTVSTGVNANQLGGSGSGGTVSSVFTRTGAVTAQSGDYTCAQVTNCGSTANPLSQFAATTSAQFFGVISDETGGTGVAVGSVSPALTGNPTAPTQAATDNSTRLASTAYVTTGIANAIAAVNPAVAVTAATAAILPNSPTYNNGVSGIGAFITTATLNTPLVVDGVTPTLNQRILVKNESGGLGAADNGIYTVTQVSGPAAAWILTRALDFDQPSDINNTGAIPVLSGTANASTQWVVSSSVATIGTDAITFAQFSSNPANLVQAVSPGAGIAHFAGSTQTVTSSAVNLANGDVTGQLPAAQGGTGVNNTATLTLGTSNQNWATLGTGIVKNTTTTGALTNAASADILGLCTTCVTSAAALANGSVVLGGGGQATSTSANLVYNSGATTLTIGVAGTAGTLALQGAAPSITTPGTTPYVNVAGLLQTNKNTCDWALTAQSANTATSLCSTAITLPASAQKFHFLCQGVWQVSASTTPTVTMGITFAQAPSATGLVAGTLSSSNGTISTSPTAISGSVVSLASGNNNIVAAQTITAAATYFPFTLNGWFTSSATSGTWSPTITVGTSASTWATAGECIVF